MNRQDLIDCIRQRRLLLHHRIRKDYSCLSGVLTRHRVTPWELSIGLYGLGTRVYVVVLCQQGVYRVELAGTMSFDTRYIQEMKGQRLFSDITHHHGNLVTHY